MMNPVLAKLIQTETMTTERGETLRLHSHLPQLEGEVLQSWVREHRPRRVLEIGLAYGVSALSICDALAESGPATYHICDPYQHTDWQSLGLLHLRRAGYKGRFMFHEEGSELCLPRLLGEGEKFDFALIDGAHTFDHVFVDFFYVHRLLEVGGVVVFDDVMMPSVERVIDYLDSFGAYSPLEFPDFLRCDRRARVRKMLGAPECRVTGFQKVAAGESKWTWQEDFKRASDENQRAWQQPG